MLLYPPFGICSARKSAILSDKQYIAVVYVHLEITGSSQSTSRSVIPTTLYLKAQFY